MAVWPALRFNQIVLAFDRFPGLADARGRLRDGPARLAPLRAAAGARPARSSTERAARPWTDDRAPVEWVTDRMIVEYAARGGELDEDLLPTACAMRLLRGDGPLIRVGHRGAAALAPENTLRSFEAALAHGVEAIEFDVLDLVDGPLVVAHSNDLAEVSHGAADRHGARPLARRAARARARPADARRGARVPRRAARGDARTST